MTRATAAIAAILLAGVALAAETQKDFKPVTVDGDDVAAVTTHRLTKGTRVRVKLVARGNGGALRVGEARTLDSGAASMTVWDALAVNATVSETARSDAYIAVAAGPKDAPLKLEKVEADTEAGATKLTFEGGMAVQVTLVPPFAATSRPKN